MAGEKEINIEDSIEQLKGLVRKTPLSENDRKNHYTNISALKQLCNDWKRLKEENKQLKKQLKD